MSTSSCSGQNLNPGQSKGMPEVSLPGSLGTVIVHYTPLILVSEMLAALV